MKNFTVLKFTDEAIKAAVKISQRYITDRFLPDKAIDLMDEAAAKVRLKTVNIPTNISQLEQKIQDLKKAKEKAIDNQDYELAATIRRPRNTNQRRISYCQNCMGKTK